MSATLPTPAVHGPSPTASWGLALGALGVVYGDIGTSPLYALKLCFSGHFALPLGETQILGVLSLFFWSLICVVSIQYLAFLLKQNVVALDSPASKRGLALIWFSTGKDDFLVETSRATVEMLKKHKFNVVYKEGEGGHTWIVWQQYLNEFAPKLFN